ncbi:MAG: dihydroorotase [Candidatus Obscuribacterales bacterium]|jgi:dihydroorotase|nr:dihydroorotase [Candidatus Obscuribacterales bacterium]
MTLLIKNGLVLPSEKPQDLRIKDGIIVELGNNLETTKTEKTIDASGMLITPGFIDMHTHLRDLGQQDKETIASGTKAAAAGGFTTVLTMANTEPVIDNVAILAFYKQKIRDQAVIEVLPAAAVTKGLQGKELSDMAGLADNGAIAFSDDGMPIQNLAVLRRALEYARLTGNIIISHAEDRDLSAGGIIHESAVATNLGLAGIPWAAETAAIAREIEIVRLTGSPYHFTHLSCAGSVRLVRQAKEDGLSITADVTPHHLNLSVDDIGNYRTCCKMNPPLRSAEDQEAIIEGIKDGTIDAIATDHAPHTDLEKEQTMATAPFGIIGLETAFALTYQKLVREAGLSHERFFRLLTSNPARILQLPEPKIKAGEKANLAIINPNFSWKYDSHQGVSRAHNSPFCGRSLHGKVMFTIFQGNIVFTAAERMSHA